MGVLVLFCIPRLPHLVEHSDQLDHLPHLHFFFHLLELQPIAIATSSTPIAQTNASLPTMLSTHRSQFKYRQETIATWFNSNMRGVITLSRYHVKVKLNQRRTKRVFRVRYLYYCGIKNTSLYY